MLDLNLGKFGVDRFTLVEIPMINTGVVFQRLPYTQSCPSFHLGEFELKNVNPVSARFATIQYIRGFCTSVDSISINPEAIYEINTSRGETYYMQLIELIQDKVKIRITSDKPVVKVLHQKGESSNLLESQKYLADGKIIELDAHHFLKMPLFLRLKK